jgi:parvulin-like peptidyl-prolyl isomerase
MRGNIIRVISISVILLFSLASGAKIAAQPLIKVNNRVITVDEFNRMSQLDVFKAQLSKSDKQELVDNVIFFELAVQEAKKRGYSKLDSVQDEVNIALFKSYFNKDIRPQVQAIKVTLQQIEKEYGVMPIIDTSHILIPSPVSATPEAKGAAKATADRIYNSIKSKNGKAAQASAFAELAKKHSTDPSSEKGGRLGYLGADQALPHYYNAVKKLNTGDISEPFPSVYGWHLAMAHRKLPSKDMGPVYRAFLETKIRTDEGIRVMKLQAQKLRKNAKVSVERKLLK